MYGGGQWVVEHWWYRLVHVCQRWRNLILGSASYLGLCLVCTYDTPVADMLAHSPPLPLVIDYQDHDITADDEEAIILALTQRDRVRRIRLGIPVLKLQKPIMVIDGEYPILEHLILGDLAEEKSTVLIFPETPQTPRLRHLDIKFSIQIPIRVPLLGTSARVYARRILDTYPLAIQRAVCSLPTLLPTFLRPTSCHPHRDHDIHFECLATPNTHHPMICILVFA